MSDNRNDINSLVIFPAFEVGYSELLHFLKSMEKNNLLNRFLLICPADFLNVHQFQVPYHIDDDFKSHANLVNKIDAWAKLNRRTFIGIIGVDEEEQFNLSKRIARRFKLPFYHDRTCSTASNKYLLKTAFKEHGVLTGDFALISGLDDPGIRRIGFPFPNVLKVLSGNGSQYLFRNENIDQLKENFRILKTAVRGIKGDPRFRKQHVIINNQAVTLNPRRQFLLEAFITGEEFSCDFVICDGMVQVVRVVRKIKGSYFGYFKGYHLLNEKELGQYNIDLPRLKGLCERIARALAIETGQTGVSGVCGVCMVDFKVMNGEWYVLEASIRPGLSAFNHLMYEVYGYTSLFLMARQRLGMAIDIRFPQENGAVVYLYAQPGKKGEKIQSFDSPVLESLKKTFEIVHIHIYEEVGGGAVDLVTDHSALLRGYVILKNIDGEKLEELAELINKSFVGSRGTSRVFQKSPWLPEALINMNNIQQELTDICGERIDNTDPDYFKEAIDSLNREVLLESARKFGTPQYLLDLDGLRERAIFFSHTMRHYIPNSEFFYAFKCNDLPLQVKTLKEEGFQADVAGIFELQLALKLGFERILFSGPGKSVEELKLALKKRKQVIVNIDNFDEIHRLKSLAGDRKSGRPLAVGFRLNAETTVDGAWSKFGFQLEELKEAVRLVRQCPNLIWTGLHFHCSWNKTPKKYLENIKKIGTYLKENFPVEELRSLRFFDIGGGFYPEDQGIINKGEDKGMLLDILGIRRSSKLKIYEEMNFDPYAFSVTPVEPLENFGRAIASALQEYIFSFNPDIEIYFEPGRFIATHATTILLTVIAIKKNCAIVDAGINMLGDYKFSEYSFAPVVNITRPSTQMRRQVIYGSLCDPADCWGYSYYGEELQKGDTLAVLNQGAYTFCTAWRFIKPIPAYIAASGNRLTIARKAEKFQNRYAGCL